MKRTLTLLSIACATLLGAETASAQSPEQTWLKDRRYREGAGWRVGDFELHPGIGADFGYDSNFFLRHSTEDPVQSLRLRVSPHFSVSTLGPQRSEDAPPPTVNFRFEVGATYNEYFPVSGTPGDQDRLRSQRNVGGDALVNLDILPQREWSGNLHAGVGRVIRPTPFPSGPNGSESFNRINPNAGASLTWTPGSGLLDWMLGYDFTGTFFESGFSGLNNVNNEILTRGRWRFLPRTALIYDASFGFIIYPSPTALPSAKANSHPLRTRIGVNGLITPSFGALAMIGWGASFYDGDDRPDFDSLLAQAEVKWYFTPPPGADPLRASAVQSNIAAGFIRDYEDAFIGTYLERDRGYLRFSYLFGGQFLLVAEAGAGAVVYPSLPTYNLGTDADAGWTDVRADGKLFGEWRIKDWLGVNLDFNYNGYFSQTSLSTDPTFSDRLGFQQFTVFGGARVFL
ncbi:MAG: hypothetical protein KC731_15480 [Myxococcales bacterium]|nr:hypothetical protein [Myxococcales bacterium]